MNNRKTRPGARVELPPWRILSTQFTELMVVVLVVAAATSLLISDLNAALGFTQEHRAERAVPTVKVRPDGWRSWGRFWRWLPQRRLVRAAGHSRCRIKTPHRCYHSYSSSSA